MKHPEWLDAHKYESSVSIFDGEIGKMHGVRFVESSEAAIWKVGEVAVFGTVFFGEGAYGDIDIELTVLTETKIHYYGIRVIVIGVIIIILGFGIYFNGFKLNHSALSNLIFSKIFNH